MNKPGSRFKSIQRRLLKQSQVFAVQQMEIASFPCDGMRFVMTFETASVYFYLFYFNVIVQMGPRVILSKNIEIEDPTLNVEVAPTCRGENFFFVKTGKVVITVTPLMKETCLGEAIPQSVADVVFKSLEKNPADRYQSVSAMLEAWRIAADSPMSFAV